MPFRYKEGRFHFLFLNQQDDYLSESLRIVDWKKWIWMQTYTAKYSRILFISPAKAGKVCVEDLCISKGETAKIFFFPTPSKLIDYLDSKGSKIISYEELRELINFLISQDMEGKTVVAIPIKVFYELYSDGQCVEDLCWTIMNRGLPNPTISEGSIFLLTSSMDAVESIPFFADKNGVYNNTDLFPEMNYVWKTGNPGSFYKRVKTAFGERMICKETIDRKSLYLLLLRYCIINKSNYSDFELLKKEGDSLYVLLHSEKWRQELKDHDQLNANESIRIIMADDKRPMHSLIKRLDERTLEFLKWSVQIFEERNKSFNSPLELLRDEEILITPTVREGSVIEFEHLKEVVDSYIRYYHPRESSEISVRINRLEKQLYTPWECINDNDPESIPDDIISAISEGTVWIERFRENQVQFTWDSFLMFLEKTIIREANGYQIPFDHDRYVEIEKVFSEFFNLEEKVGLEELKLKKLEKIEKEKEERVQSLRSRLQQLARDSGLKLDAIKQKREWEWSDEEKEYVMLSEKLASENMYYEQANKMLSQIKSWQLKLKEAQNNMRLGMEVTVINSKNNQMEGIFSSLREIKDKIEKYNSVLEYTEAQDDIY